MFYVRDLVLLDVRSVYCVTLLSNFFALSIAIAMAETDDRIDSKGLELKPDNGAAGSGKVYLDLT